MLEKTVETYLVDRVRAAGGDAYKFSSPARVSVPDRIVVFPPARIYFVELKSPTGKVSKAQLREHERLRALGCDVRVINSREAVDAFVREASAPAAPYLHVYEYPSPFGGTHREFAPTTWNGQRPARTVPLYAQESLISESVIKDSASKVSQAADRESVIAEILCKLDGLIKKGPLDEPAHSERNGMVLAFNAVAQLSTEQPAAAPTVQPNPATAAILFALSLDDGSSIDFLNNWNEGEFDVLRREWPEAPEAVYIGADPFHPLTRGGAA
ncbi:hypothetical protein K6L09_08825 [Burkholderia cepacia]